MRMESNQLTRAYAIVSAQVADVRCEPGPSIFERWKDPLQQTQVLKGDPFIIQQQQDNWFCGSALNQPYFSNDKGWVGYPGWIRASHLQEVNSPSHLVYPPAEILDKYLRQQLVKEALSYLNMPYHWGGLSRYDVSNAECITGVDCSGLVHLAYRSIGWLIPRDAQDQFRVSAPIENGQKIEAGDLIFLESIMSNGMKKITHVQMYVDKDLLLESTMLTWNVRLVNAKERLGALMVDLSSGDQFHDQFGAFTLYFGQMRPMIYQDQSYQIVLK